MLSKEFSRREFLSQLLPAILVAPSLPNQILPQPPHLILLRLQEFDQEINRSQNKQSAFFTLAPQIGAVASDYFYSRLNHPSRSRTAEVFYQPHEEFLASISGQNRCNSPNFNAYVPMNRWHIYINLHRMLYQDTQFSNPRTDPAIALTSVIFHERRHLEYQDRNLNPSIRRIDRDGREYSFNRARGISLLRAPGQNTEEACYIPLGQPIDEIVTQEYTIMRLNEIGILSDPTKGYETWLNRYHATVLSRFNLEERNRLLNLQNNADPVGYFSFIGSRLGYRPEQAEIEARNFCFNSLS